MTLRDSGVAGIYCDQPAKVLVVDTQDDLQRAVDPSYQAAPATIRPRTSAKLVGGCGTSVDHFLAMAFDDPTIDDDLCLRFTSRCPPAE